MKLNKKITKGICLLLTMIMLIPTNTHAAINENNQDSDVGVPPSGSGNMATKKEEGEAWNDLWQGLRVYIVDETGTPIAGSYGTVIDFLYNPQLMTETNFANDFKKYKSATGVITYKRLLMMFIGYNIC